MAYFSSRVTPVITFHLHPRKPGVPQVSEKIRLAFTDHVLEVRIKPKVEKRTRRNEARKVFPSPLLVERSNRRRKARKLTQSEWSNVA